MTESGVLLAMSVTSLVLYQKPTITGDYMNKMQRAMGIVAAAERDKPQDVTSKRRAGTKKASYKVSTDGINNMIINTIANNRRPKPPEHRTVGIYGPQQGIRVWRK